MFTDRVELFVPPKKGKSHVLRVVSEILRFRPAARGTDIKVGLDYLGRVAKRRSVAFLLSDFIDEGWDTSLKLAQSKHDLIPVCISDPVEQQLPMMGVVNLEDPETGQVYTIDTSDRSVRGAFVREVERRRVDRETLFRKHRLDYINVSTADPDMSALVSFFRIRAKRAMR
jgi:uncharacterized protein (DUF58 family)